MKKIIFVVFTALMAISLAACGANNAGGETETESAPLESETLSPDDTSEDDGSTGVKNALVAYFSATGHTRTVAEYIAECADADIYEIVPEDPYTAADLDYNSDCRANREQNDDSARPAISAAAENIDDYDVIFLGYPIWWGEAPKIMYTFLESYDFSGKTIIPFCTSGSSPIGKSAENMKPSAPDADWYDGGRLDSNASREDIASWVDELDLAKE